MFPFLVKIPFSRQPASITHATESLPKRALLRPPTRATSISPWNVARRSQSYLWHSLDRENSSDSSPASSSSWLASSVIRAIREKQCEYFDIESSRVLPFQLSRAAACFSRRATPNNENRSIRVRLWLCYRGRNTPSRFAILLISSLVRAARFCPTDSSRLIKSSYFSNPTDIVARKEVLTLRERLFVRRPVFSWLVRCVENCNYALHKVH